MGLSPGVPLASSLLGEPGNLDIIVTRHPALEMSRPSGLARPKHQPFGRFVRKEKRRRGKSIRTGSFCP
jgi:hypothetical protein